MLYFEETEFQPSVLGCSCLTPAPAVHWLRVSVTSTDKHAEYQRLLYLADGSLLNVLTRFYRYTCCFRSLLKDYTLNVLPLRQYSDTLSAGWSGFDSSWGRDFLRLSIPALGPTQPLVKEVLRRFTERKRPECGVDYLSYLAPRMEQE